MQAFLVREQFENRLVGGVNVGRVAAQSRPAERSRTLAEQRPDVLRYEARNVEGVLDAGLLRLRPDVVSVIERHGPGLSHVEHRLERLVEGEAQIEQNAFLEDTRLDVGVPDGAEQDGIELPHLLLMAIMEVVLPGNRFISIRATDQLETLTNTRLDDADRADMQQVLDTYPVRLSMHTIRQMRVSGNVAYQYLPFVEELDSVGHTNTWIGQFHQGLLEQMYANRVIFLLNMSCPVYCRFCFRKHKESRNETNPTVADVRKAVDHVRRQGGVIVEAYPSVLKSRKAPPTSSFMGTPEAFRQAGFTECAAPSSAKRIMRYTIK